jgi:putative transposase
MPRGRPGGNATDQRRPRWPELAALIDDGEHDLLAHVAFPTQHRIKPHSTNSLERLNEQVKRRANILGIFRTRPASPG